MSRLTVIITSEKAPEVLMTRPRLFCTLEDLLVGVLPAVRALDPPLVGLQRGQLDLFGYHADQATVFQRLAGEQ